MRQTVRGAVAAVAVAGVVLGAVSAAEAKPKKQSTAKYAKTVCSTYMQLLADYHSYAQGIHNLDTTDIAGFAGQATTQTNMFLAIVKAGEDRLQGAYPDVSNGKKIGTLLATNATEIDNAISDALSHLENGGVAGPAAFVANVDSLNTKITDTFSKVTDQDLINAFQREKTCKKVVRVIG
jgi:hypothetical protein